MNGSIAAHYSHDVEVDGLTKMRFRVLEEAIRAPLDHEENSCFCVKEEPKEKDKFCHLDGIIDISGCHSGVPIALSKPHFFKGSPLLRSHFKGLEPNREKHESYFDIDPVSVKLTVSITSYFRVLQERLKCVSIISVC